MEELDCPLSPSPSGLRELSLRDISDLTVERADHDVFSAEHRVTCARSCDAACDYCMAHICIQLSTRTPSPACHAQVNSRRISRRSLLPDDDELQQVLRRPLNR
jgi:hypothetical protein